LEGLRIAASSEALRAGKFEYEMNLDSLSSGPAQQLEEFVRLKSGQTYTVDARTFLLIALDRPEQERLLDGQPRYLQVWLWNEDDPLHLGNNAEKIQQRWLREGFLWTEGATSIPIPIRLVRPKTLNKCR